MYPSKNLNPSNFQAHFQRLLSVILELDDDFKKNISLLVSLCGEILRADACMYNRLEGEMLSTISGWKLPSHFKNIDKAKGHLCYDVIKKTGIDEALIVKNLSRTPYYKTDPNVKIYGLKTYVGVPVYYGGKINGSLCMVYKKDVDLSPEDIQMMKLIANFIGIEENHRNLSEQIHKRIQFEELVSRLASRFINLSYEQIDNTINEALREIGEFCGVDRSYIFMVYNHGSKARNTHEWCAKGIKPSIDELKEVKAKDFAWFAQKIRNKEVVYVAHRNLLPKEAEPLRKLLTAHKVLSLICVPMVYEGEVIGFLGFDAVRKPKEWSPTDIATLKLAAEIFASCLMQKKIQRKLIRTNMKLREFSLKDPLTGLYNQRYFEEVMERELMRAKRQATSLSILMLDLDYFKSINELYGFRFGDLILVQLVKKIKTLVRKYDIVIRYSGEEFIIIAPGIDRSGATILAERIFENISACNFGNRREKIKIKFSIAVVSYPEDGVIKVDDMVELAEKLLLRAKEKGGNAIVSCLDIQKEAKKPPILIKRSSLQEINKLKDQIERAVKKTNQSLMESIYAFAKTIEAKDQYTGEHVEKTVYYAVEIARRFSLPAQEIEFIRQAAILHDLGKVGISEKILIKKGKLSPSEFKQIKQHPRIAAEILRAVHFFHPVIPIILSHHERWDGRGYPYGLKGEEIPLGARILAIADVFQALISDRPYRKAYPFSEAVKIIKNGRASYFDPRVVDAFLELLNNQKT